MFGLLVDFVFLFQQVSAFLGIARKALIKARGSAFVDSCFSGKIHLVTIMVAVNHTIVFFLRS